MRIGISSLTAKILCQGHNSQLSGLDAVAQRFFQSLKTAQLELQQGSSKCRTHAFDGKKLERWFLKVLFMMWRSGNLAQDGQPLQGVPPGKWSDYLLGAEELPARWGLHVLPSTQPFATVSDEFEIIPMSAVDGSGIKGARFKMGRLPFTLIMGNPNRSWGIHRPARFVLQQGQAYHILRMRWDDFTPGEDIIYTRIGDGPLLE